MNTVRKNEMRNKKTRIIEEIREKFFLVKFKDIIALFNLLIAIPYAIFLKMKKECFWLICERKTEARDNGYCFFCYMQNNVQDIKTYYAIDKKCKDYNKLLKYKKNIIAFGSIKHMAYYLACDANISSVKNMGPNDLIGYVFRKFNIMNEKMIFLQHGIIMNNLEWLHYPKTKFGTFCCASIPEYDYVTKNYKYPTNNVVYTGGLCRFDFLNETNFSDKQFILVMPTWRKWLKHGDPQMKSIEGTKEITETNYFKYWLNFLNSDNLKAILEWNNVEVYFYPHPTMQYYIDDVEVFNSNVKVVNGETQDIQKIIREASALVTDYSSVFWDFVYMGKPIAFYQFDRSVFFKYHYSPGYFDYEKNAFSKVYFDKDELIKNIEEIIRNNYKVNEQYEQGRKKCFPRRDNLNCKRTYDIIYKKIYRK